ncbi:hypothetical protein A2Z33_07580 [Candidatus Gottesmanbacteria bacterium RBG_16_52_11]|uniref:ChsH2 C-terminal OB-fold domain-containing protein n=1 Tax=Candidatus Gottesmanbacteria bacterium RBG_16_52_11 TaxID=1798374 RepID=A0A1F5YN55_9BACT|nr:MAG: hypothetical protein A2Z33_07580 [Candidatus Gottesmanbacteria bacterium RBG_16_52_11]
MVSPVKVWRNQRKLRDYLGHTGVIVSYSIIRVPPFGFAGQAPYPVVIIRIDGSSSRIFCQMVDCLPDDLRTGRSVRLVLRRVTEPDPDGVIPYGLKAVPVSAPAAAAGEKPGLRKGRS